MASGPDGHRGDAHNGAAARGELADVRDEAGGHGTALAATRELTADDLVARLDLIRDAMEKTMKEGVDYGVVPGSNKPSLWKPGSDKLGVLFRLDVEPENEKIWGPGDHLTVISRAPVYYAPTGERLGVGEAICSTQESKYKYRKQDRICPQCGAAAVRASRFDDGGWFCWQKLDGCGATFSDGDSRIEDQDVGEVENDRLPDLWNTVTKIGSKRARIDGVLAATGASAIFTQDNSDEPGDEPGAEKAAAPGTRTGFASNTQERFMRTLLEEAALEQRQVDGICAYAAATMEGGRGKGISRAIDGLKGSKRETAERLLGEARSWARTQAGDEAGEKPEKSTASYRQEPRANAATPPGVDPQTGEVVDEAASSGSGGMKVVETQGSGAPARLRKLLRERRDEAGLSREAVEKLSGWYLCERWVDRLNEKQTRELCDLIEAIGAGGISEATLKGQITKAADQEDQAEARAVFQQWVLRRANEAEPAREAEGEGREG